MNQQDMKIPMKNVHVARISQSQINFYNKETKALIGRISQGFFYGDWWVEPENGKPNELIKGKKNAVKYLLNS